MSIQECSLERRSTIRDLLGVSFFLPEIPALCRVGTQWVFSGVTAYSLYQGLWFSSEPVTHNQLALWDGYTEPRTVWLLVALE